MLDFCSPGYPGTHSVDQAGLEFRDPPVSASLVLGLMVCTAAAAATTIWHLSFQGIQMDLGLLLLLLDHQL